MGRISEILILAVLFGAIIFGIWLFEPLSLSSAGHNFVETPFILLTAIIFFCAGFIPAAGLKTILTWLHKRLEFPPPESGAALIGSLFLGLAGGVTLILACLPGMGKVSIHDAGTLIVVVFFFMLLPSAVLGTVVGVHLPWKVRFAALIPILIIANTTVGYLFLYMIAHLI